MLLCAKLNPCSVPCSSIGWRHTVSSSIRLLPNSLSLSTHIRKGNLSRRPLLQQQVVIFIKEKDRKGPVEDAVGLVFGKDVRVLLAGRTHDAIVLVEDQDRVFLHEVVLGEAVGPGSRVVRHGKANKQTSNDKNEAPTNAGCGEVQARRRATDVGTHRSWTDELPPTAARDG